LRFNRAFLLLSLFAALLLPLLSIPVNDMGMELGVPGEAFSISKTIEYSGEAIVSQNQEGNGLFTYLFILYGIIGSALLARFVFNIYDLINKIRASDHIEYSGCRLVLLEEGVLPHSFFMYIFVNKRKYNDHGLDNRVLAHELAHCRQIHTLDIIIVELFKIVFWINPFVWLLEKQIRLNHEFLADERVVAEYDIYSYQNLLFEAVSAEASKFLTSNFNFSFTKNRILMMKKKYSEFEGRIGKLASIAMFVALSITISCNQEVVEIAASIEGSEWWKPILEDHSIPLRSFNNLKNVFEMGDRNSINNGMVELENAFFLINSNYYDKGTSYVMVEAPFATHHLETDTVRAANGALRIYSEDEKEGLKVHVINFERLKLYVSDKKLWFRTDIGYHHMENAEVGKTVLRGDYYDNIVVRFR